MLISSDSCHKKMLLESLTIPLMQNCLHINNLKQDYNCMNTVSILLIACYYLQLHAILCAVEHALVKTQFQSMTVEHESVNVIIK